MLLSDPKFIAAVQDRYILAWDSVRPAPKVSIDFGNGKRLTRTLKGSTAFYVCRPDGRAVDILPGVYTPADFLSLESESRKLLSDSDEQLHQAHATLAQGPLAVAPISVSKSLVESPILTALPGLPADTAPRSEGLDDLSRHPLRRPQILSQIKVPLEASGDQIVVADSARYRKVTRPAVERYLANLAAAPAPEQCTMTIFKEILNVPIDDPYLGLGGEDIPGTP